jgi:hypothetical protein
MRRAEAERRTKAEETAAGPETQAGAYEQANGPAEMTAAIERANDLFDEAIAAPGPYPFMPSRHPQAAASRRPA